MITSASDSLIPNRETTLVTPDAVENRDPLGDTAINRLSQQRVLPNAVKEPALVETVQAATTNSLVVLESGIATLTPPSGNGSISVTVRQNADPLPEDTFIAGTVYFPNNTLIGGTKWPLPFNTPQLSDTGQFTIYGLIYDNGNVTFTLTQDSVFAGSDVQINWKLVTQV